MALEFSSACQQQQQDFCYNYYPYDYDSNNYALEEYDQESLGSVSPSSPTSEMSLPSPTISESSSVTTAPSSFFPASDISSGYDQHFYQDQYFTESSNANITSKSKKTQPTLSVEVKAKRRLAANARERKRMTKLNNAFERLRAVLPNPSSLSSRRSSNGSDDRPLSKMEALQLAQTYIAELATALDHV